MCACEICKLNACAIALNNLTPRYVTTTKGKLMAKMPAEIMTYQTQILVEVTKALMTVKAHPLHD
jgi:Late competence development protein ComFB.